MVGELLDLGFIPVLHGDGVLDDTKVTNITQTQGYGIMST